MFAILFIALLFGSCHACVPNGGTATTTTIAPATLCARRSAAIANNAAGVPFISAAFDSSCRTNPPAGVDVNACVTIATEMTNAIRQLPNDAAKFERVSTLAMNALGTASIAPVATTVRINGWGTLAQFADCTPFTFADQQTTVSVPWPAKWTYSPSPLTLDVRQSATQAEANTKIQADITAMETSMKAAAPGLTFSKINPPLAEAFVSMQNVNKLPDGGDAVRAITIAAEGIVTKICNGNKATCTDIAGYGEDVGPVTLFTTPTGNVTFSQMVAVQSAIKTRFPGGATYAWN